MPHPTAPRRLTIGVVFGGVSPEHEVSVISALQAAAALDRERFTPVPLYIAKDGLWYTGGDLLDIERYRDLDALLATAHPVRFVPTTGAKLGLVRGGTGGLFKEPEAFSVDVLFLGLHGGAGESGGIQGLAETLGVPYTGSSIVGSAVGIDKIISKRLCRDGDVPIVPFVALRESEWGHREEEWLDRCEDTFGYPAIVKPARLGSSIGISKADDRKELDAAIEEALRYDDKIVVEKAITPLREVNCSVLGTPERAEASVIEEPIRTEGETLLTFQEKYQRGGGGDKNAPQARRRSKQPESGSEGMASLGRQIPADLDARRYALVQEYAVRVFQLFECAGVARIDFLVDDPNDAVYFNEINTIPGSFSFYLWEPSGVPFPELLSRMIDIALAQHSARTGRVRSYDTNLLSERSAGGLKGKG